VTQTIKHVVYLVEIKQKMIKSRQKACFFVMEPTDSMLDRQNKSQLWFLF
jgi:hypothetical protein